MISNIEKYKNDITNLSQKGEDLHSAIQYACYPKQFKEAYTSLKSIELDKFIKNLPDFTAEYQSWYSEVKALVKQLLPDRLDDLVRHYQKPKPRKDITFESYRIEDYLQGLQVTRGTSYEKTVIVDGSAAIPHFRQQMAILKAASARFESSLFDIKQLVQADIFDSELEAARELAKNAYLRAAGAIAGVVLERHLGEVCEQHNLQSRKKHASISDFNEMLKSDTVIDIPTWRKIQRLGDLRNLCDHSKGREPTADEIEELISGVDNLTHNLF